MKAASKILAVFVAVVGFSFSGASYADLIKMSSSGLCHPPQSSWYERTNNYKAFDSLVACLGSGGELPKGLSYTFVRDTQDHLEEQRDYERSAFGHGWSDADGDCQNSRAEALIVTSTTPVRFASDKRCRVVTGRWISPFTNQVIQNAADIDIDHIVPLAWAWDRGARLWSIDKRKRFANDKNNLWPVEASLNRSKGSQGPDQWLPPAGQCGYLARFVRIVKSYDLEPARQESTWMQAFLENCRS